MLGDPLLGAVRLLANPPNLCWTALSGVSLFEALLG